MDQRLKPLLKYFIWLWYSGWGGAMHKGRLQRTATRTWLEGPRGTLVRVLPMGSNVGLRARTDAWGQSPYLIPVISGSTKSKSTKEKPSVGPESRDNLLSGPTCSIYLSHLLSCFHFLPCFGFLPLFYKAWVEMDTYHLWFNWKLINGQAINHWNKHTKDELILWVTQTCW